MSRSLRGMGWVITSFWFMTSPYRASEQKFLKFLKFLKHFPKGGHDILLCSWLLEVVINSTIFRILEGNFTVMDVTEHEQAKSYLNILINFS